MIKRKIVIIGGGPAGLAAAIGAKEEGILDVLIIERDNCLGGILNQCIHNGFGLHIFNEELTGPEYAAKYVELVEKHGIEYYLNTMVTHITKDKVITAISMDLGKVEIEANSIILAMGCRERPRGALNIPGYRPQGIYSAGTAQYIVNIEGKKLGKEIIILGSGDIGLIMARRMTLEGAHVKAVVELMPKSGGLQRNIVQCLEDYNIPLLLSHTIIDIKGKEKIQSVVVAQVDENKTPILDTVQEYQCDTLLISCGLIPENELSEEMGVILNNNNGPIVSSLLETNIPGVFACGNVLKVHELVDHVSIQGMQAGKNAARYCKII